MRKFLRLLRLAVWRAFVHDQFAVAKAAAYSAIFTLFPAVLVIASVLNASHTTGRFVRQIMYAIGHMLPEGTQSAVLTYFQGNKPVGIRTIIWTSLLTLWTGSGVMISWMDGFHRAYQMPRSWSMTQERIISFLLVILAGIPMAFASFLLAFGYQIEHWMIYEAGHELGPYILGMWTALRWMISTLTSIAVIALIYHHGVPRTQPWHRVLPGAVMGTFLWFASTVGFGVYLRHFATYSAVYGSVATAIALLIWLYLVSLVVLIGAEFNALFAPRFLFGTYSELKQDESATD
ncbi:MAG TPA: YihY/virulence factor BrkB family protein [Candidatus Acidoferrales bacterium]|nr:YihY/virulence factor BrkB family protein [Candidatus Acidoferrales bacterium]